MRKIGKRGEQGAFWSECDAVRAAAGRREPRSEKRAQNHSPARVSVRAGYGAAPADLSARALRQPNEPPRFERAHVSSVNGTVLEPLSALRLASVRRPQPPPAGFRLGEARIVLESAATDFRRKTGLHHHYERAAAGSSRWPDFRPSSHVPLRLTHASRASDSAARIARRGSCEDTAALLTDQAASHSH